MHNMDNEIRQLLIIRFDIVLLSVYCSDSTTFMCG